MSSERVPEAPQPERCHCGLPDCLHFDMEYPWCRSCAEHHRAPECPLDQEGYSLATCGCRWDDLDAGLPHRPTCCLAEDDALIPGALTDRPQP
jgi:hypothetical protein